MGLLVFSNQFGDELEKSPTEAAPEISPPGMDPVTLNTKMMVKLAAAMPSDPASLAMIATNIDKSAETPLDSFRGAMAVGVILGVDGVGERLDAAEAMNDKAEAPIDQLSTDIELARRVIENGPDTLEQSERDGLLARHGWFARALFVSHLKEGDPAREAVTAGGGRLLFGLGVLGVVAVVAFLGSIAASVVMGIRYFSGQIRPAFQPPAPGGSVYLEVLPVFVLAFILLHLAGDMIVRALGGAEPPAWLMPATIGVQWLLLGLTLYPLLRGVRSAEHRAAMGWHTGRGFWIEVWSGIWGYLAGLPLVVLSMGAILVIMAVQEQLPTWDLRTRLLAGSVAGVFAALVCAMFARLFGGAKTRLGWGGSFGFGVLIGLCVLVATVKLFAGDTGPPANPIAELLTKASGWTLAMVVVLAVVWAPLAEESIFRGAFYRHLRTRAGVLLSAIVCALIFGVMHGYDFVLLGGVISLGFVFSLLREWRGSLIAPITAHALHNGTLMLIVISILGSVMD